MSRQLIRDDNLSIGNFINASTVSANTLLQAIKALKVLFTNELLTANISILTNTIQVSNPLEEGSQIRIIAPNITLNATNDVKVVNDFRVGDDVLFIDTNNKKVGINQSAPAYELDVSGNINFTGNLYKNGVLFTSGGTGGGIVGQFVEDPLPVGTIIPYTNTEVPRGWMKCDGRELSRTEYSELFDVIGVTYGLGDGLTTFKVPDLRGRNILGEGDGDNLTTRLLGDSGGEEYHTLTVNEMPSHSHEVLVSTSTAGLEFADNGKDDILVGDNGGTYTSTTTNTQQSFIKNAGANQGFSIMSPFLVCNYIIKTKSITTDAITIVDGNVGIGITTPDAKLHVNGDLKVDGQFVFGNNNLVFDPTGKIGIGKSPTYALDVLGDINLTGNVLINGSEMVDPVPVGTIIPYTSSTVPDLWLPCDGSLLSRTEYYDLFAVIGTTYGSTNTTNFRVPDLRGRDIIGSGQGTGLTNRTLGETGGEERHILTISEMPSHTHNIYVSNSTSGLEFADAGKVDVMVGDYGGSYLTNNTSGTPFIQNAGSDASFNVMQPYMVCNYIIKAKPSKSLYGIPYNHWTKSTFDNNLSYTTGTVITNNLNVIGAFRNTIITGGVYGTSVSPIPGGSYVISLENLSSVQIELDSSTNTLILDMSNNIPGIKGEIILNERSYYGRRLVLSDKFVFPNYTPRQTSYGLNRILYDVISTSVLFCSYERYPQNKGAYNRTNTNTRLSSIGTGTVSSFLR